MRTSSHCSRISPVTSNSSYWKTSRRMTVRPSGSFTRSPTSAHQPFRRTVTNTSSIYGSATLSSPHAIAGWTKNLRGGLHGKPEIHLLAAPPALRNGGVRGQSSLPRPDGSFSVSVAFGRVQRASTDGSNWSGP
jgi:hypothetical protein